MITNNEITSNQTQAEQVDQNLIEETMQCLLKTFTEKNNQERAKAESRLKDLGIIIKF